MDNHSIESLSVSTNQQGTIQPTLLFTFSFIFASSLSVIFHELGHGFAGLILGSSEQRIKVNLFAQSYCLCYENIPDEELPIIAVMGPFFNIVTASFVTLLLWKKRKPNYLPWLLWGPIAYVSEGLGAIEVITYNSKEIPFTDITQILYYTSIPPVLVFFISIIFLFLGIVGLCLLLPLLNFSAKTPLKEQVVIVFPGITLFLAFSIIYVGWLDQNELSDKVNDHTFKAKIVVLGSALILLTLILVLYERLFQFFKSVVSMDFHFVDWKSVLISSILASSIAVFEVIADGSSLQGYIILLSIYLTSVLIIQVFITKKS